MFLGDVEILNNTLIVGSRRVFLFFMHDLLSDIVS